MSDEIKNMKRRPNPSSPRDLAIVWSESWRHLTISKDNKPGSTLRFAVVEGVPCHYEEDSLLRETAVKKKVMRALDAGLACPTAQLGWGGRGLSSWAFDTKPKFPADDVKLRIEFWDKQATLYIDVDVIVKHREVVKRVLLALDSLDAAIPKIRDYIGKQCAKKRAPPKKNAAKVSKTTPAAKNPSVSTLVRKAMK